MNTASDWTLTVRIDDPERRELWRDVFPDGVVPVQSADTINVRVPGRGEVAAYMLDLYALSDYVLAAVAGVLAERFGYSAEEVEEELYLGVPIPADGVCLCVAVQHDEA